MAPVLPVPLRSAVSDPRKGPLFALAALLLVAGSTTAWYAGAAILAPEDAPAFVVLGPEGHDHSTHSHESRAGLPQVPCPEDARVPEDLDRLGLETLGAVAIRGDEGFTPAAGISGGSGTAADPFVIRGVRTPLLQLSDTTAYFVVAGSDIGTLVLDWNGKGGLVCRNHIGDLRVNRNVERVEAPTAGIIEGNRIDKVGQIRHYDGMFRDNEVGTATSRGVVLNIDGMNGADFARNAIRGGVDMKIHGHHHGVPGDSHMHVTRTAESNAEAAETGEGAPSADEGAHAAMKPSVDADGVDHADRPVLFRFHDNTIVDPSGFGLRYNDRNHAGDDRTAASEASPQLELPHVHRTTILIENNTIASAPLRVEIVNAADERHLAGQHASLVVRRNVVKDVVTGSGIIVSAVSDADVLVSENTVQRASLAGVNLGLGTAAGIDLVSFGNSTVRVVANSISGFTYGVRAREFDAGTSWSVGKNSVSGAKRDVWWDGSVPNPPAGA